jgi:hypothetical protein
VVIQQKRVKEEASLTPPHGMEISTLFSIGTTIPPSPPNVETQPTIEQLLEQFYY